MPTLTLLGWLAVLVVTTITLRSKFKAESLEYSKILQSK